MKIIPLTKGKYAIVDDANYDYLNQWKWFVDSRMKSVVRSQQFSGGKNKTLYMSRVILGLDFGDERVVDHINHNIFDNRIKNLRICTQAENCMNTSSHCGSTSRFIGVNYDKLTGKWRARIAVNGKQFSLGRFIFEELAALAHDFAAMKYHRKFASFNF